MTDERKGRHGSRHAGGECQRGKCADVGTHVSQLDSYISFGRS